MDGGGWKTRMAAKTTSQYSGGLWSMPGNLEGWLGGIHTGGLHVQAHILKLHPSLILSWVFESWFEQSKQK